MLVRKGACGWEVALSMKEGIRLVGQKVRLSTRDCSVHEDDYKACWAEDMLAIEIFFCP